MALWKDAKSGQREISVDTDAVGVVLTLSAHDYKEWTADGRDDRGHTTHLTLSGVEQVKLSRNIAERSRATAPSSKSPLPKPKRAQSASGRGRSLASTSPQGS